MNVVAKLTGFLVALGAVFGVAYLAGNQSEALLAPVQTHGEQFAGLSASVDGYTITAEQPVLDPAEDTFVEFLITGPDGRAVPEYQDVDDTHLHLVAFRRDLTGYQHIYPEQGEAASWWAILNLTSGPWHVIVEFTPKALGRPVILSTDFSVRGRYQAQALPAPVDRIDVEGLAITRQGRLTTRVTSRTKITVTDGGRPVTDIQPAHGGLAHAVIIRPGDLGYLHLHAVPTTGTGPILEFDGGPPDPGTYRLFVEFFRSDRLVVTPFTVTVSR